MRSLFVVACGAVWVAFAEQEEYFEIPAQPESPRRQCDEFPRCAGYWVEKVNTKEAWYVTALLFSDALSEDTFLGAAEAGRDGLDRLVREAGAVSDVGRGERGAAGRDGLDRLVGERDVERREQGAAGLFVRATIVDDQGDDVLQIHEAYAGLMEGSIAKITGSRLRCLREPCLSTVVEVLNTGEVSHVSEVVFNIEKDVAAQAEQLIQRHSGFLAATTLQEGGKQRESTAVVVTGVAFRQGGAEPCQKKETSCGGHGGCKSDSFCHFTPGAQCGHGLGPGKCTVIPAMCASMVYAPVCGCDGLTHVSECVAHSKGTSAAYTGSCTN